MSFASRIRLPHTELDVGRIGFGSSYGVGAEGVELAYDLGMNFFYWGSMRRGGMKSAIQEIASERREDLVVVLQSYSRVGGLLTHFAERGLRALKLDHAEVLLLGWHNQAPSRRVIDAALELREKGRIGCIALSTHHRRLLPTLLDDETYSIWHVRYNAVHRGAEREVFPCLEGLDETKRPGLVTYTTTRWGDLCNPSKTPAGERTPTGTDCYRFAISRPEVDMCLAGPNDVEQMKQALAALEQGPMDEEELAWMRRVGDQIYANARGASIMDGK